MDIIGGQLVKMFYLYHTKASATRDFKKICKELKQIRSCDCLSCGRGLSCDYKG